MEIIVREGEIACNKQFFLFSQCFLPYVALIFHFKCTLKCCLQFLSIWTSLKFCSLVMGLTPFCQNMAKMFGAPLVQNFERNCFKWGGGV